MKLMDSQDMDDLNSIASNDKSDNDSDIESIYSDDEDVPPPPPPLEEDNDKMDDDIEINEDDDDIEINEDDDDDIKINDDDDIEINDEDLPFTNTPFEQFSEDDDEMDDDEMDDDDYLQKFDENNQQQIIQDHHPELHQHNIDEINAMTTIIKDKHGNITDPLHKTLPFITKYEKARILGERSKQIASGAIPLINIDETIIDSYIIATKEFEEKAIPFIIKRPLPSGGCEYWKLADLEILV
jgi:DNA-directed RNA polymerase subunit K/omega|tara:strand:+ start:967 stop:1689 length:723 start_codon:yes stop_codon:yes gene_type:complete